MHTDTHTLASFAGNIIHNNYQEMTWIPVLLQLTQVAIIGLLKHLNVCYLEIVSIIPLFFIIFFQWAVTIVHCISSYYKGTFQD